MGPTSAPVPVFNNIPARSREQRLALKDREQLEKERLRDRKEGFQRVDTSMTGKSIFEHDPASQGFMCDADRFHSDTAGEAKAIRDEQNARTKMHQEHKRYESVQREITRWKTMDTAVAEEEKKWESYRASGSKARRNKSGEPMDPITLRYNDGKDGERLRAADEAIKRRAIGRAQNLQQHNSREGINPITGEPLRRIQIEHLLPPPTS